MFSTVTLAVHCVFHVDPIGYVVDGVTLSCPHNIP